jgi:hypothetical protein
MRAPFRSLPIRFVTGLLAFSLLTIPAVADTVTDVQLQYRPRAEIDKRFGPETAAYVTHRARLNVGVERGDWRVFLSPQDVRGWGAAAHTAAFEPRLDLHQGYVQWSPSDDYLWRIGRQEIVYLNQRLIGGLNWAQQGRSFDGVRLSGTVENVTWDVFGAALTDEPPRRARDGGVSAALLRWDNAGRTAALLGVGDFDRDDRFYRWTVGPHTGGRLVGPLVYTAEAYYQFGHQAGASIDAYLAHGSLGWEPSGVAGRPSIRLGYDVLSGDTDSTTTFDTLYPTNHLYYGYMDAFLDIPDHTDGRGLQDLHLKAGYTVGDARLYLAVHHFLPAPGVDDEPFGTEIDAVVTWTLAPKIALETGVSVFFADDAYHAVRPQAQNVPYWGYGMLTATLP